MGLSSLFRNRFSRSSRASNARRDRRREQASGLRPELLERRTVLATNVLMVTSPNSDGAYNAGDQVIIQVEFARPITITSPSSFLQLRLNTGNYATFTGQSGAGSVLNFRYDVEGPVAGVGGDNTSDLDVLDAAALVNATFSDADGAFVPVLPVGTGAGVTNSLAYVKDIVIDTTPPTTPVVNELRVNPNIETTNPGYAQVHPDYFTLTGTAGTGPLAAGETLTVSVNGCTYVLTPGSVGAPDATGTWRVDLLQAPTSGGPLSPWSTTSIQQYQAQAVYTDAAGNTSVGHGFVVIDMVGPTVENVTATNPNGAYTVGDTIDIEVWFLEPVEVVGAPQLALGLDKVGTGPGAGAAGRVWADYNAAASSGKLVVFSYTIQAGDTDADLEYELVPGTATAISLNGGMIEDLAGNPANLAMPAPAAGTAGTLGFNKDIVIDTTAPAAPVIVSVTDDVTPIDATYPASIVNGGVTNDPTLLISGTADPVPTAVEVQILINGVGVGTVPITAGTWSFVTAPLANGTYVFTAIALDAAGNPSLASNSWTVTVDLSTPAAPVIASVMDDAVFVIGNVTDGGVTNDTTPTLAGTAEANSTVTIYRDGTQIGTATAGPGGAWTFPITTALAEGTYVFTAQATDKAGNTGLVSAPYTITVDTTAPAIPIIISATDDVLPLPGVVADGGVTNDTTLLLSGTCEAGTTVQVFQTVGTTTTALGNALVVGTTWSLTTNTLANGITYKFTARATDVAGNQTADSNPYTVTVDTTAPNPPTITGVDDDKDAAGNTVTVTNVPNGGRTNDTVLVLRGKAEANSTVEVFEGVLSIGTTTADANGDWTFTTGTLADGMTYSFTATAADVAGNVSTASVPPYVVTVDTTAPATPVIAGFYDDAGVITGNVTSGGTSNDTTPVLSGTMEAGTTGIEIWDGTTRLTGTFIALTSTTWNFSPDAGQLTDGVHVFTAVAVDGAGNRSGSSLAYTVTIDTVGLVPAITGVEDDVLPITGPVPNGGRTNDTVLVLTGTAEAGSTVYLYNDVGTSPVLLGNPTLVGGGWSFTTAALAEGTYNFVTKIVDAGGNESAASPRYTVTVDLTAPARPTITAIVDDVLEITGPVPNGGVTNDTSLVIQGQAEPNALVLIYETGTLFGQATADGTGAWSCATGMLVGGATYSFTATATDAAGNVSGSSLPPYTVTIDLVAPGIPTIASVSADLGVVAPGGVTNDATLNLAGTTDAGTRVHIFDGATEIGEATVAGTAWTYATAALASGTYSFRARSMDAAGNTTYSAMYTVTVDTVAPGAPVIIAVTDNVLPVVGPLLNGAATNDNTLDMTGTAELGSTVRVYDGATLLGTATLVGTTWTFVTPALLDGIHILTATATDAVGNTGVASTAFTVTVDTAAPSAPVITGVMDNVSPVTAPVADGGTTNDNALAISGTAEPGSTVTIYDGMTLLGTVTAGIGGTWTFTTPVLADGIHVFTATATDAAGNVSPPSAPYTVTVDTVAPVTPVITTVTDNVPPVLGPVLNGGTTNDNTLDMTGTAEAGSTVQVYDGTTLLGAALLVGTTWTFTTPPLSDGIHVLTVTSTDAAGNVTASAPFTVTVDTVAPGTPVITSVYDDVALVIGNVLNGGSTNDNTLAISGTAEPGSTVTIYDGVTVLGTVTAGITGAWAFTTPALLDGIHVFTAIDTDAAGNVGSLSAAYTVTVDTAAPAFATITSVVDNVLSFTGPVTNGGLTNDNTLAMTGTAEAGSTVEVYDGTTLLGLAALAGTAWTFTTPVLGEGIHVLTATASDAAGNVTTSAAFTVTVDTAAPNAPVITQAVDNFGKVQGKVLNKAATDDTTPSFSGTTDADTARVAIYRNGTYVGDAQLSGTTWSFLSTSLASGTYTFTAKAYDAAGNASAESSPPYTVTVVGPITASSPTFPASPIRPVSVPITSFAVVFNQPVTGFTVANLKLYLGSRPVDIRGATVTKSASVTDGTTWIVSLPLKSINAKGNYRLDITGANIVSLLTGASMTGVSSLYWKRV